MVRCPKCGGTRRKSNARRMIEQTGMCGTCYRKLYGGPTKHSEIT